MSAFTAEDRTGELKTYPVLEYGQSKASLRFVEAYDMAEAILLGAAGSGREATVAELIEMFGENHEK